jgi:micrococcal nuclease
MRRIYRRRPPHWLTFVVIAIVAIAARYYWSRGATPDPLPIAAGEYEVERVVDGDTIIVRIPASDNRSRDGNIEKNRIRVRLLGVDAPESVKPNHPREPFGLEASKFTKDFLAGDRVTLQLGRRRIDDFGRTLAFVFVEKQMLNEELVRAGLARATTYPGDESPQMTRIRKAQNEAKAARRGIWSK